MRPISLDGSVVILTGASDGIGAACAKVLAERGAKLSLNGRNAGRLRSAAGPGALLTVGDLTDPGLRQSLVERTLERYGRIDVLINNAGMGIYRPAWNSPDDETRRLFELNCFAPLALSQLVIPHMRKQQAGTIVNVGSIGGRITLPWMTLYSASKFALGSLTEGLRMELAGENIHAMTVCPGYVQTEFQKHALGQAPPDSIVKGREFAITPERCARDLVHGIERRADTVITPRIGLLAIAVRNLFPRILENKMTGMNRTAAGK